ncbi:hypothetical protein FA13DRAFT_1802915 [Coprinellus micaceus]|uniref:Uncharacterized protein n=1 Tax=Coprinellus micaceus TaxID=71717 RepID=A0A4Y7SB35_COPMI|nr:hypothetical protein FA13DRAFT_1802915 [Coprinellus micaceus]
MDTTAAMDILTNHTPKDVDEGTGPGYWGKCGTGALLWLQPTHLFAVEDGQPGGDDAGTGEDDRGWLSLETGRGTVEDEDGLNVSLEFSRDRLHRVIADYGNHQPSSTLHPAQEDKAEIPRGNLPMPTAVRRSASQCHAAVAVVKLFAPAPFAD